MVVKCPAPTAVEGAGLSVRLSPFVGWGCERKWGVVEGARRVAVRATWISRECLPRTVTSAPLVCIVERQSGLALAFCGRMR